METKEAVLKVLADTGKSKYWMSQQLKIRPIMVSNYLRDKKPCKMGLSTAKKFKEVFDIEITDAFNPIKPVVLESTPSGDSTWKDKFDDT